MSRNEAKTGGTPDTDFSALDRELEEMARETPEVPADFHAGWTRAVREEAARRQAEETVDLPDTISRKTDVRRQRRYILSAAAAFVLIIGGAMLLKDRQDSLLNRVKTDPPAETQTAAVTPEPAPAMTPAPMMTPAPEPAAVYAAGNAAEADEAVFMAMALRADENAAETEEADAAFDAEAVPAAEAAADTADAAADTADAAADMADAAADMAVAAEEPAEAARANADAGAGAEKLKSWAKTAFGAAVSNAAEEVPAVNAANKAEAPAEEAGAENAVNTAEEAGEAETENAAVLPAEAPAEEVPAANAANAAEAPAETAAEQAPASAAPEEAEEDASFLQRLWVGFLRITPYMLAIVGVVLFLVTYIIRAWQRKKKK